MNIDKSFKIVQIFVFPNKNRLLLVVVIICRVAVKSHRSAGDTVPLIKTIKLGNTQRNDNGTTCGTVEECVDFTVFENSFLALIQDVRSHYAIYVTW